MEAKACLLQCGPGTATAAVDARVGMEEHAEHLQAGSDPSELAQVQVKQAFVTEIKQVCGEQFERLELRDCVWTWTRARWQQAGLETGELMKG